MSFEGYYQILCVNGHLGGIDCALFNEQLYKCQVCEEPVQWWNLCDMTNGSWDDDGRRIDGFIELEVLTPPVICHCDQCGDDHIAQEATYKAPDEEVSHLDHWPKTVEEACDIILEEIAGGFLEFLAKQKEADLFATECHRALGKQIRNRFGLWSGNKILIRDTVRWMEKYDSEKLNEWQGFYDGVYVSSESMHPDESSAVILYAVWEKLNENEEDKQD